MSILRGSSPALPPSTASSRTRTPPAGPSKQTPNRWTPPVVPSQKTPSAGPSQRTPSRWIPPAAVSSRPQLLLSYPRVSVKTCFFPEGPLRFSSEGPLHCRHVVGPQLHLTGVFQCLSEDPLCSAIGHQPLPEGLLPQVAGLQCLPKGSSTPHRGSLSCRCSPRLIIKASRPPSPRFKSYRCPLQHSFQFHQSSPHPKLQLCHLQDQH